MMKATTLAAGCAFAIVGLSNGALASEKASAPNAGTYQALLYVQSVNGSGCIDKAGFAFTGSMSFSGLGGTTHYLRALETGNNFAVDSIQTLTVKTRKGTTHLGASPPW